MKVGIMVCSIALAAGVATATPLPGPAAEVKSTDVQVKLPPVPDFALPPASDAHDPRELRTSGHALLGQDVAVTGYVIWIYDCLSAVRRPGESKAAAQQRIDDDQTICERAKFYLGDSKKTPLEKGLWVVDVPRPPYKLERERLPKEQLDAWPAVPKIKVGDLVTVTGRFDLASPHKERNSDGLLVFASIAPARASKRPGKPVAMPLHAGASLAIPQPPPETPILGLARNASINQLNEGNKLLGQKQPKEAIARYEDALKKWPDNALAGYGEGLANIELKEFAAAIPPLEHSVAVSPDQPMYQLWDGIAMYEAKVDEAKKQAGGGEPDLSAVDFTAAREHLQLALAENANLWRAHYYLGKIWRAQGAMRDAATEFSAAITANPREWGPYVALGELYRKWDYIDAAIAVAEAGTRNVLVSADTSDIFYILGMGYEEKGDEKKAIDAFTRAIAANDTNVKVRFQRGQAYFKLGTLAKAKEDLEAFVADQRPSLELARAQAAKMLADIAAAH